jgi:hypothetical protein
MCSAETVAEEAEEEAAGEAEEEVAAALHTSIESTRVSPWWWATRRALPNAD